MHLCLRQKILKNLNNDIIHFQTIIAALVAYAWLFMFISAETFLPLESKGSYFVDCGDVKIEKFRYAINYSIPMNALMTQSFELKRAKLTIKTICLKLNANVNCEYFLRFMETNEKLISTELQRIRALSNRPKRFLTMIALAYVWIKQWVSNDGLDQQVIDQLQEVDTKNRELTEQHIKISNATLEIQNRVYHKLKDSITLLQDEILQLQNTTTDSYYLAKLSNIINFATLVLVKHYQYLNSLTKLLMGEIDTNIVDLIGREILLDNLTTISHELGEGETLPFSVSNENLFNILMAGNNTVKIHQNTIFILISVPVVEKNIFKHFQILSIPMKMGDNMWTLENIAHHIFINKESNSHILLSNEDIKNCKLIDSNVKICSITNPVMKRSSCEFEALTFNVTTNCKVREMENKNYIYRVNEETFIVIPYTKIELFITCDNNLSQMQTFESDTVIKLNGGCTLENDDLKYSVYDEKTDDVSIMMTNDNESTIQIGDLLGNLVEVSNKTVFFEESEEYFKNITQQLNELFMASKERPKRIVVSHNELGLLVCIIIALISMIGIRIGYVILKKKISF